MCALDCATLRSNGLQWYRKIANDLFVFSSCLLSPFRAFSAVSLQHKFTHFPGFFLANKTFNQRKKKIEEEKKQAAPRRRKIGQDEEGEEDEKKDVILELCTRIMGDIKDFKVSII